MSEVQSRPPSAPRGRGSSRGGRGGSSFGSRGGASGRGAARSSATNGDLTDTFEDQGEVGQLKKQYASQLAMLKEMFPDWTTEDVLYALQENQGDLEATAAKITEGFTAQWGEVKKKNKDRARSKVKETPSAGAKDETFQASRSRGGRTFDSTRGGRGRGGSEHRGGRGGRGRGGIIANGVSRSSKERINETTPTVDEASWGTPDIDDQKKDEDVNGGATLDDAEKQVPAAKPSTAAAPATKGSWASLLKPAPLPPAPVQAKTPKPAVPSPSKEAPVEPEPTEENAATDAIPEHPVKLPSEETPAPAQNGTEQEEPEAPEVETVEEEPQQPLTEDNLEKIEDIAPPAPTGTAASTVNTTIEKNTETTQATIAAVPVATPPTPAKQPGLAVPKGTPSRPSSFRRVLDQQEGVVMPSNHAAVDRTALQFGSMGLNEDEDEEVETAETVSQPPQPSPLAQPVTSLPPTGPSQLPATQPVTAETIPTPRQAPGLPVQPQTVPPQAIVQPPVAPQSMTQQHQVHPQLVNQYNRYGVPEQQAKPFDTFGQPVQQQQSAPQAPSQPQQPPTQHPQQPQGYSGYMQPHQQQQQQQPSHIGIGVSSAPDQHYNFYTDRSQPPGFNMYNNSYMHTQQAQSQQEAGAAQQRAASGLSGAGEPSGQVPTSASIPGQVQQPTSRYGGQGGEQSSGHATPSPAMPTVQQTSQPQQGYPAVQYHPYYNQFVHQNYYPGGSPFSKGLYTYPQGAYMSPQYSDHSSSPAGLGGFGAPSTQGRDGMGGLGDYGRTNTSGSQQSLPQHSTSGAYGNGIPNFLNSRGLPQEQQQLGNVGGQQPGQQGQSDDTLKFENKPPTGPSSSTPGLQGQPGRPGSATSGATGLGPQQNTQAPAGMYGSHLNPNLHGHQGQQSGYGVGQGQNTSHYSMYSGAYPSQYPQNAGRQGGGGTGWYGH